jgi:hypothetical protein
MNGNLKTVLRVAFLVVLVYALAAMVGVVSGFSVRVGSSKRRRSKPKLGMVYTGMVGELVESVSNGTSPAGTTPVLF